RANHELAANFDLDRFRHHAFYNTEYGRIEMHLVSCRKQTVDIAGEQIEFDPNEPIITEYSYKYRVEHFRALASAACWKPERVWEDKDRWFSVQYFRLRK